MSQYETIEIAFLRMGGGESVKGTFKMRRTGAKKKGECKFLNHMRT